MNNEIKVGSKWSWIGDNHKTLVTIVAVTQNNVFYEFDDGMPSSFERNGFIEQYKLIPEPRPKWYQVFYKRKEDKTAFTSGHLFKSKRDFLEDELESNFEWIVLKEVGYDFLPK